jgi:hypothetical protein
MHHRGNGRFCVLKQKLPVAKTAGISLPGTRRNGIALMITLFFIIAITAAVGVSLMHLRLGGEQLHEGRFLVQSSAVLDDVLTLLERVQEISPIQDADSLNVFLLSAGFLPLEALDLRVKIEVQSKMGHLNINTLSESEALQDALSKYMLRYNVQDIAYMTDLLIDCMSGPKEYYRTDIFDEMPWLYRERIVSQEHLQQILDFYTRLRHDNSVQSLPWSELVRFGEHNDTALDANYVTPEVWQVLLPTLEDEFAEKLADGMETYASADDLDLSEEELSDLEGFSVRYYVPAVHVSVDIEEHNRSSRIAFDYNLTTKKGSHFVYGI